MLFGLAISGCQVGPKYHPPETSVANSWKSPQSIETQPHVSHWWEVFQDPKLSNLVNKAIANSPSLLAVTERVEQARNYANVLKSRLFPQLNFDPSVSHSGMRVHSFGSLGAEDQVNAHTRQKFISLWTAELPTEEFVMWNRKYQKSAG